MATEKDNVNNGLLGTIAAVLALSVLGIALAVTALVRATEDDQVLEKSLDMRKPYDEMRSQQQSELTAAASWADKGKGTASVPIDRAMELVVKGVQADPNSATAPAPPPKPAAADAGAEAAATEADGGEAGTQTDDAGAEATDAAAATGDAGALATEAGADN